MARGLIADFWGVAAPEAAVYHRRFPLPCGFLDYLRERVLFVRRKRALRRLRALLKRYSSPSTEEECNARRLVERLLSLTDDERSVLFCYCRLRSKSATARVLRCSRQHVHDVLKRIPLF